MRSADKRKVAGSNETDTEFLIATPPHLLHLFQDGSVIQKNEQWPNADGAATMQSGAMQAPGPQQPRYSREQCSLGTQTPHSDTMTGLCAKGHGLVFDRFHGARL